MSPTPCFQHHGAARRVTGACARMLSFAGMLSLAGMTTWCILLAMVVLGGQAQSQTRAGVTGAGGVEDGGDAEDVEAEIERRDDLFGAFAKPLWDPLTKRVDPLLSYLEEKYRLRLSFAYDVLTQGYVSGSDGLAAMAGDATLNGRWQVLGHKIGAPITLGLRVRHRHRYGDRAPSELGDEIGTFWRTTQGFTDNGFEIPDFFIEQEIFDGRIDLRYGQMNIRRLFDSHRMRSSKQFFLNRAFAANPSVGFPRFGTGVYARWKGRHGWDLSVGASNMQGVDNGDAVDWDLGSSDLFEAIQLGYSFDGIGGNRARFQLMGWNADAHEEENIPEGRGGSITLEHAWEAVRGNAFARYAYSGTDATETRNIVAFGVGAGARTADFLGVAVGAGDSTTPGEGWQGVGEIFYRWQANATFQVTPDLQVLVGKDFLGGGNIRFVVGLRGEIMF